MLDPQTLRSKSFSLCPTGYNPDEVDSALDYVAGMFAAAEDVKEYLHSVSFEITGVGYEPTEVDQFFVRLSEAATETAVEETAVEEEQDDPSAVEDDVEQADATAVEEVKDATEALPEVDGEDNDVDSDESLSEAVPMAPIQWQSPRIAAPLDLDVIGGAVSRTAGTLDSLQSFIENEIAAMRLAVERQAQEVALRCETLLAEASADAEALNSAVNKEIARARKASEREIDRSRRDWAKELKAARAALETEVSTARREAERHADSVRAQAEREAEALIKAANADRAEAQKAMDTAIAMQSSIAESLERARQQLTPQSRANLAA